MEELKIVYLPPGDLTPYALNAKKHDATQIQNVANSIKRFGWKQPIVIDDNNVVVIGHCRLLAAKKLRLARVPCIYASGLSEDELRELRIADNKTNESEWNYALLGEDLEGLSFDGFEFDDLLELVNGIEVADVEEDSTPPTSMKPTKDNARDIHRGQIWKLGCHRLMCGSSTDAKDVDALLDGETAALLFTSPPYGDLREYNKDKDLNVQVLAGFIKAYAPYTRLQAVNLGIIVRDSEIVPYWNEYIESAHGAGLKFLSWCVWDKMTCGHIGQQKMMVPVRHEWILLFGKHQIEPRLTLPKKEASIYKNGTGRRGTKRNADGSVSQHSRGNTQKAFKKMETLLECPDIPHLTTVTKQHSETGKIRELHPATFPVALPSEYIVAFSEPGEIIIEPFCGSGTTLIACEQLNRKCYAMELDETYMNVIIDRWESLTGRKAILEEK